MRKRGNSWALEWHSGCSEGWWLNSCIYLAVIPFAFVSWSLLVGRSLAKEKREGQERKIVNPDYFLLAYKLIDMVDFFTVETQSSIPSFISKKSFGGVNRPRASEFI